MTDVFRVAEFLELPFSWPDPDPVVQYVDENGLRRTGEEQPYVHRLTRLGVLAEETLACFSLAVLPRLSWWITEESSKVVKAEPGEHWRLL